MPEAGIQSDSPTPVVVLHTLLLHGSRDELEEAESVLSADERERATRFVNPDLRKRWVFCRARVRFSLASHCNTSPASIRFDETSFGKPILASGGGPRFNLSHSKELALLAISDDADVGVDIEADVTIPSWQGVASRCFTLAERQQIADAGSGKQNYFFRCWTRKEAFVKTVGEGMSLPLNSFEVCLKSDAQVLEWPQSGGNYCIMHLEPMAGYVGALGFRGSVRPAVIPGQPGNLLA